MKVLGNVLLVIGIVGLIGSLLIFVFPMVGIIELDNNFTIGLIVAGCSILLIVIALVIKLVFGKNANEKYGLHMELK